MQLNNKKTMILILTLLVLLTTITVISAADNSTTEVSDVATCDNSVSTQTSHDTSKNNDNLEQTTSDSFGSTHSNISTTQSTSTTKYTNSNSNSGQLTSKVADSTHTSTQSTTSSSTEKQADTSQKTSTSQSSNSDNQVSSTDSNSKNTSTTKDSNNTLSSTNSVKTNTNSIDELNSSTNKVSTNLVDEKTQLKTSTINADGSYTVTSYDDLYNTIEDIKTSGTDESYTIYLGTGKNETFIVTDSNQPIVWNEATSNARNLVIDGQGLVTIDGLESTKEFIEISAGYTLTLQNISIINYYTNNTDNGIIVNHGTLNVVNSYFSDNYAKQNGLIYNEGNLTVDSSTFIKNRGYQNGVIQTASSEDVYIIDSTFALNTAGKGGGAIAHTGKGKLYIINSIFTENEALGFGSLGAIQPEGGAIYCQNSGDVIIQDSTFNLNSATATGQEGLGGAIYAQGSNLYINNSKFIENSAKDTSTTELSEGGAIYLTRNSNCTINGSEFIENQVNGFGGAIYCSSTASNLVINSSKFTENSADYGGVIYINGGTATINSSTFSENSADYGGVIYNSGKNLVISYSNFTENTASIGGVIYNTGDNLKISYSNFTENSAVYGGAINNFVDLTIEDSTFKNNHATVGGAIYSEPGSSPSTLKIIKSEFTENSADYGGAVYNSGEDEDNTGTLTIENSEFYTNTATYYGGAIYNDEYGDLTLKINTFEGNEGYYSDTIFTNIKITEMTGNTIIMSDYDVNTFEELNMYSPIIDTTADTDSEAERGDTIVYDISYPSGNVETSEVIIMDSSTFETYLDYPVNDGGVYRIDIVYRDSENYISYNVFSHDVTHITLDSGIVANPSHEITINGYLISTNEDKKYDDYSNKNVTVYINGELKYKELTIDESGHFEFEITPLEGYNSIYVVYDGYIIDKTTYIAGSSNITGFNTNDHNAIITAVADPDKLNVTQSTVINGFIYDLDGNPLEGTIFVQISDRTETTVKATNGEFQYKFEPSTEGTYTFIFSFADDDYTAVSDPVYVTVVRTNTNIIIDTSDVKIGEDNTITITLQGDFGWDIAGANLVVSVNGANKAVTDLKDGSYTIQTGKLTEGTHTIIAYFEGDNIYYGSQNIATFTLSKFYTNIDITYTTPEIGTKTTITATLTDDQGNPIVGRNVVISLNGVNHTGYKTDENGEVYIVTGDLTAGMYTIEAYFDGDEVYYGSHATTEFNLARTQTILEIKYADTEIVGEKGTVTITLTDDQGNYIANAPVTVMINGVKTEIDRTDDNGQIIIYTDVLTASTFTIEAYYDGNDKYYESHASETFTLSKINTYLEVTTENMVIGKTGTITATLTDDQGNYIENAPVTISINGVDYNHITDNNGQITIQTNVLTANTYTIEAYYEGNNTYYESSDSEVVTLSKLETNVHIDHLDEITPGEEVTITGILTLSDEVSPIGYASLVVIINGEEYQKEVVTDESGHFIIPYTVPSNGQLDIVVLYRGNDIYENSYDEDVDTSDVPSSDKINTQITINPINDIKINDTITVSGVLRDQNGNTLSSKDIIVTINGQTYTITTDNTGGYTLTITPSTTGAYTVNVQFEGDDSYFACVNATAFYVQKLETTTTVDAIVAKQGETVNLTATVVDERGNIVSEGQVAFKINDVTVTDENGNILYAEVVDGVAKLPYTITNSAKNYTITALYYGSDDYYTSRADYAEMEVLYNGSKIPTTTTVDGIVGKVEQTIDLTAIVLDENGNLVPEGQVLFKINDVTVKDENGNILYADVVNGVATLPYTITNSPKNYTIMAVYQGTDTYLSSSSNHAILIVEAAAKIPTTTIVDSITGQKGETVNLTATVYDEDGNLVDEGKVIFKINDVTLKDENGNVIYVDVENGVAKLPYTITNNPKNYTILAVYQGTDKYMESRSDYATLTVEGEAKDKIPTTTVVEGITSQKGETVNLTATVYDEYGNLVPEGQVLFKLNDVTVKDENGNILYADVVNGVARLPYTITNSPKNYTLLAIYQGTDNYYSSRSDYSTLYVVAEDTKIPTVTYVDSITAREGETVNLTATVYDKNQNKVTEGQVYFEIDNQIITDSNGNILYATVVDGVAKLPYTVTQDIGNYTLKAVYTENNKYYGSESDTNGSDIGGGAGVPTLTVVGENYMIPTNTTVNGVTAKQGDTINLTANVVDEYGNPVDEGQLSFKIDGVSVTDEYENIIYVDVTDGVAKLPYTVTQDLGNYTITAEYGGTNKYLPSQADDTIVPGSAGKLVVVDKNANITTNIVVDDAIQQWGDVVKFTATITDEYGNPVTGGKVAFKLNGVTIKDGNSDVRYVQVVDGKAELYYTVTNNVKDYVLTAVYSGYDIFEEARSLNATLTVTPRSVNITTDKLDNNIKSGDTVTFKATISEYDRTYTDNGVVVFKLNGKTIKDENGNPIVVDVNNGVATLDYTIPVDFAGKDYNITAVYTNNNYLRAEANNTLTTVRSNVQTELNPITVSQGQDANIYMVLYDENGNQLERETKVAIKINGHTIIHMNTTAGVLNATIPASEITQTTNRIDVVLGENQGYYELRLNTTLRVEN